MALTVEQNRRLTEVGPGTPMGALLRRYWHPVAAESEFVAGVSPGYGATKAVRILGEDLVLYRTTAGEYGLIEPHCPHRQAGLVHGYGEADGLRCSYHGWKYGLDGRCLEQPFEDAVVGADANRFKDTDLRPRLPRPGPLRAGLGVPRARSRRR